MSSKQLWPVPIGPAVQEAGTPVLASAKALNFTGSATVTDGGNGIANVAITGGGGGGDAFPSSPPETPGDNDDGFTTDPLDARWTQIATSGLTILPSERGTWLSVSGANANPDTFHQALDDGAAASGEFWSCAISTAYGGWPDDSVQVGFCFQDTAVGGILQGNYMFCGLGSHGTAMKPIIYDGADRAPAIDFDPLISQVHWLIQRSAGNKLTIYASIDGQNYRLLYSAAWAHAITDFFIRFVTNTSGTSEPNKLMVDYVWFKDPRFAMPSPT